MAASSPSNLTYVPSFDGLRALAVGLVMLVHYRAVFLGGWIGVPLFFVLSGFLITRILYNAKETTPNLKAYLKAFWIRRALRIFPLSMGFMLLCEILWLFTSAPKTWLVARPWLLTYTLNFGHMFNIVPISDVYTHFWSLAVEEQFYLIWPFVVWFLDRAALRIVVISILLLAPLLRFIFVETGTFTAEQLYFFTPTLLDSFAVGAALVLFDFRWIRKVRWWLIIVVGVTLLSGMIANWYQGWHFTLWCLGYPYNMPAHLQYVWGYSLLYCSAGLLVLGCLRNELNFFSNKLLVDIGKISYGIYIIHRPVFRVIVAIEPFIKTYLGMTLGRIFCFALFVVASLLLAKLSFRYFETPFLRLKSRFKYAT